FSISKAPRMAGAHSWRAPEVRRKDNVGRDSAELPWGVSQLLELMVCRLCREGHMNRSDLMVLFGGSVNQACSEQNSYIGFAADIMGNDMSALTCVRAPRFKPHLLNRNLRSFPANLCLLADGVLNRKSDGSGDLLSLASTPTPEWNVDPGT